MKRVARIFVGSALADRLLSCVAREITGPLKRTLHQAIHRSRTIILCILLLFGFGGVCHEDKYDYRMVLQPKYNPDDESDFWVDRSSARPPVPGTVPLDGFANQELLYAVRSGRPTTGGFPFQLTRRDLEQGQRQFTIFCAPCHGALGDGNGMIPQRGFAHPPSFYLQRLRDASPGYFYDVITNGYGAMYSYNERVSRDDRWRIAGYIRALQLSDTERK